MIVLKDQRKRSSSFSTAFLFFMDFGLLSPLEFFVDPKIVDGRLLCDTFFLQLIAPDDNFAAEVISGVTDLFPAGRNVIVGVKVIPLFVDHLPLVSRIAFICILIPLASAILLPLARCQCMYGDLLTGITSRYLFR